MKCTSPPIRSHLVAQAAALRPIAEGGHIYEIAGHDSLQHEGLWKPQGVQRASVFPGFCQEHDQRIFREVDDPKGPINARSAGLLCYRAITRERWARERNLAFSLASKEFLDRGRSLDEQIAIQNYLNLQCYHSQLGIHDDTRVTAALEALLLATPNSNQPGFHWHVTDLGIILPVVGCGGYCCAADFRGMKCRWHEGNRLTSGHIATLLHAVVPWQGTTKVVFGWLDDGYTDTYQQVVASFATLDEGAQREAAVRFLFEVSENIFARKSWWDGLSADAKVRIQHRLITGGANEGHSQTCLLPDGVVFLTRA